MQCVTIGKEGHQMDFDMSLCNLFFVCMHFLQLCQLHIDTLIMVADTVVHVLM